MASPILKGGVNRLQLVPGGKEYFPGDPVPATAAQLRALKKTGIRFEDQKAEAPKADDKPKP